MSKGLCRLLGLTFDDQPIYEPIPEASAAIYAGMGGGKTTGPTITTIQCLLADHGLALQYNDVKGGEISHQIAEMCQMYGRKFGVIDDFGELGLNYPYRLEVNAFGAGQAANDQRPDHLPFVIEAVNHALIEEPADDKKNFYWRESGREYLEHGQYMLYRHNPRLATPGGLHAFMSDPECWDRALEAEAQDCDSPLRAGAQRILETRNYNPEHYSQHIASALNALKVFSYGPLKNAGRMPDITHEELIRDKWVVGFVSPVRYAERIGPYIAQHILSLMHAQLSGGLGRTCLILDEYCAAPLREAVNRITVFRAFGMKALYITQSRMDAIRKYGEKEIAVLEDNCAVKQYLKFSNIEEAERLSRAIGDQLQIQKNLGLSSEKNDFSPSLSLGKERIFTAEELMRLPDDEQIIHIGGVGFIHCRKIRQNHIAPYCYDLSPNPLEGGILPPDPKVTLDPTPINAVPINAAPINTAAEKAGIA